MSKNKNTKKKRNKTGCLSKENSDKKKNKQLDLRRKNAGLRNKFTCFMLLCLLSFDLGNIKNKKNKNKNYAGLSPLVATVAEYE